VARIFLSYRREDSSGYTVGLRNELIKHLGKDCVFWDLDKNSIPLGSDYGEVLEKAVGSCDALVSIIGPNWLTVKDPKTALPRLENPKDWVRREIATALGRKIPIIPALVQGSKMPEENALPEELSQLARRSAIEISDQRWDYDIKRLVEALEQLTLQESNWPAQRILKNIARSCSAWFSQRAAFRKSLVFLLGAISLLYVITSLVNLDRYNASEWRPVWGKSVSTLTTHLSSFRSAEGGYGDHPNIPDSWSSAQFLYAFFQTNNFNPEGADLKLTVKYLLDHKEPRGWSRLEDSGSPSTGVTSWVGMALLASLLKNDYWSATEKVRILDTLRNVYDELSRRQSDRWGGWSSFANNTYKDESAIAPYATNMALSFLLQIDAMPSLGLLEPPNAKELLRRQIRLGVQWILEHYSEEAKGWEMAKDGGLHEDLTTMNLLILTQAKRQKIGFLGKDGRYALSRHEWLSRHKKDSGSITETMLKQMQHVFDDKGNDSVRQYSVYIIAYPLRLLLVTFLIDDPDLSYQDKQIAETIANDLWNKLPSVVQAFHKGFAFRAAETIAGLGIIGRHNGWIN
jgi:hypothetical protein